MTHDELLAKVNELDYALGTEPSGDKAVNALRAVVELHEPRGKYCPICSVNNWGQQSQEYPCLTIQAIQKELA